MKRLIVVLTFAVVTSATAQVITTLKSYRKADLPPLPPSGLLRAEDGTLYGMNAFALYKWQSDGSGFIILKQIPVGESELFSGHLALSGGTLYGARSTTGRFGGDLFSVFKISTDGTGYMVLKDSIPMPSFARSPGVVLSGNALYGWGFKINTDGTGYIELAGFPYRDPELGPEWHLDILVSGNHIFGTTVSEGHATLFRLNTDGTGYTVLVDVPSTANINWSLTLIGDTLYTSQFKVRTDGTGYVAGSFLHGNVYHDSRFYGSGPPLFSVDMDGNDYTELKTFAESTNPPATSFGFYHVRILTVAADTIYGVAQSPRGFEEAEGLDGRGGALFRINTDGSGFTVLHEFEAVNFFPDGILLGRLTVSNGVLYGTDETTDGSSSYPRVYSMNTDGSGFTILNQYDPSDDFGPLNLPVVSGSTLFGTGGGRGDLGNGDVSRTIIYRMDTDGNGYSVVKEFISPDNDAYGLEPSTLAVSGNTLFCTRGGSVGDYSGSIFKLNTDGTGLEVLRTFSQATIDPDLGEWINSDGVLGSGELTLSGTTLYGTAGYGGQFGYGTVFKMNTDGTGFSVLKHFAWQETLSLGPLLTLSGGKLYGTSGNGFLGDSGTVFRLNTDGTGFTIVKQFSDPVWDDDLQTWTNSDGAVPLIGPVWNNTLYGTTSWGGEFGFGSIFRMNTDGTGFTVIAHFGDDDLPMMTSTPNTHVTTRLVQSGSSLYVAAPSGGQRGAGAIFRIDLEPRISIQRINANSLRVSWPSAWVGYSLQRNANGVASESWDNVSGEIEDDGTRRLLMVNPSGAQDAFFRLFHP